MLGCLLLASACSDGECDENGCGHPPPAAGQGGEGGEPAVVDDDPVEHAPPKAHWVTPEGFDTSLIGAGYDLEKAEPRGRCVEGTLEVESAGYAAITPPYVDVSSFDLVRLFGIESSSRVVGLDQDEAVRDFVETFAADGITSLSTLSHLRLQQAFVSLGGDRHPLADETCPDKFVYSLKLGAQYSFGLRFQLKDESVVEELYERFGTTNVLDLLQTPEKVEEVLTGRATVEVFVLQIGGGKTMTAQLLRDARCSASELEGCADLLDALSEDFGNFNDGLSFPTVDDYGGWVPTQLQLGNY
jgi:hypothetical protein